MATTVEIIHKQTIKPSSPTPKHLKTLKLSLLDQFASITYTPLLFLYPQTDGYNSEHHFIEKLQKLQKSLSETLNLFYPLAGRLNGNTSVDCSDQGAEFVEARIDCLLLEILRNPDAEDLRKFLPAPVESPEAATGNQLLVQATVFECGGLAIGVSMSHKIADAATLTAFVKCWSGSASNSSKIQSPVFRGASIFPPIKISLPKAVPIELVQHKCITRRFVFTASKIGALRARVASTTVPKPTRAEAVSGLLWKSIMTALRTKRGYSKPSVWFMPVNLGRRLLNLLPENSAGNFLGNIAAKTTAGGCELDLKEILAKIRKEMDGFNDNHVKELQGEGALEAIVG